LKQYFDIEEVSSCCSLIQGEHSNSGSNNQPSDNDCNDCSPFASCNCCSMVFSFAQPLDNDIIPLYEAKKINYTEYLTLPLIFAIWQPPKIS
jgi:hypothetical protein